MGYRLTFEPDKDWGFASEWPEMPREEFPTKEAAMAAASAFVSKASAGGYDHMAGIYWARQNHADDKFSSTQFTIKEI